MRTFPVFSARMGTKNAKWQLGVCPALRIVFARKNAERTSVRSAGKTGVIYLIVSSSSPALTDWPPLTKTSSIVPSMRATTLVSIFMASITASTSLTLT